MLDSRRMRIPADAKIPAEKLTHYLLVLPPWDDKAKFLAQAGFDRQHPETLWTCPGLVDSLVGC
jgi:hypothetical protein